MRSSKIQRQQEMLAYIEKEGKVRVQDLATAFQITTETVRQDLKALERIGKVIKMHGWVRYETEYRELSIDAKKEENIDAKDRISKKAVELIEDGMMIWLDPGSTVLSMTKYLPLKKDLTIVTNAIEVLLALRNTAHKILYIGGEFQRKGGTTTGTLSAMELSHFHFDLCFLGSDGFKKTKGPTTFSLDEMLIKQIVSNRSEKTIVLADVSKFENTGSYQYIKFSEIDCLITNALSMKQRTLIRESRKCIEVS